MDWIYGMRNSLSGQICSVSAISARQMEIKWPNWPGSELNFGFLSWKFGFFFKTCSEPKLKIWPFYLILAGQNGHKWLFGCQKMAPNNFSYLKTWV